MGICLKFKEKCLRHLSLSPKRREEWLEEYFRYVEETERGALWQVNRSRR